jgi:hypothetical protein
MGFQPALELQSSFGKNSVTGIDYMARKGALVRAVTLICIVVVMIAASAQASHVHSKNSKLGQHDCSVCSVAHSGVLVTSAYRQAPSFSPSAFIHLQSVSLNSFLLVSSLHIRPPPSV